MQKFFRPLCWTLLGLAIGIGYGALRARESFEEGRAYERAIRDNQELAAANARISESLAKANRMVRGEE